MQNPPAYSATEDQIVRDLFAAKKSDIDIVAALRAHGAWARTQDSVRCRRRALGLLRQEHKMGVPSEMRGTRTYWEHQADATEALASALRRAGVKEGVHTKPQTERPRFVIVSETRSASRWVYPAGETLVR